MKKRLLSILIWVPLLYTGCEKIAFSPEETNMVTVTPKGSVVDFDFSPSTDTLGLWGTVTLNFSIDGATSAYNMTQFYLDGDELGSTTSNSQFTFNTSGMENRSYVLTAEVWSNSNSGSLADMLEAEFSVTAIEQIVYVDNTLPGQVQQIEFGEHDGTMRIEWPNYGKHNFQEYRVYKIVSSTEILQETITTRDRHYWDLIDFVGGGPETFRIDIRAADVTVEGEAFDIIDSTPQITLHAVDPDGNIELSWEQCAYETGFSHYSVERLNGNNADDWIEIAQIHNISQTSFSGDAIVFGDGIDYRIKTNSNYFVFDVWSESIKVWLGEEFPLFSSIMHVEQNNSYYIQTQSAYKRLDALTLEELAVATHQYVDVTRDGSRAFGAEFGESTIYELDPLTFGVIDSYETIDYMGYETPVGDVAVLSPTKVLYQAIKYDAPSWIGDRNVMFEPGNTNSASHIIGDNYAAPFIHQSSEDGNYVAMTDGARYMYDVAQDNIIQLYSVETDQFFAFYQPEAAYVMTDNNSLQYYRCASGNLFKEYPLEHNLYVPGVDNVTGYLGGYAILADVFRIYDLSSGEMVKELPVIENWWSVYHFANSSLFSEDGYMLKLDF